jgi:hypothetical protein
MQKSLTLKRQTFIEQDPPLVSSAHVLSEKNGNEITISAEFD